MIEIRNCPFCGSTAKLAEKSKTYYKGELTYNTYVYCPNCDARGKRAILSHFPTNGKAREHVIQAWNRRAETETVPANIEGQDWWEWEEDNEHV